MKAYVSWQSYCIALVAVVVTNRYESVEFKDINSIHYGEWRITAPTSQQLQLKYWSALKLINTAEQRHIGQLRSSALLRSE
jgi:hypothetical protein